MFTRRAGTAGISGHLYETKLISLLYFRAFHDYRILEFQLASNVDNIGAFDDICFKAKVKGFDKPVFLFIQAKHRENKKHALKIDLAPYFMSYLKIRQQFDDPPKDDLFFTGPFNAVKCLFVYYTTARDDYSDESTVQSSDSSDLNYLIETGGTAKQPYKKEDIDALCKVAMNEQMISLAERIAKFINNDGNFQMMLSDKLVARYHIILAQKVIVVSEIKPENHRFASFRHDFFDTNDEYLTVFKNTLFKEILEKRKVLRTDIKHLLSEILTEPTDASKLSKLIGTVITYNNGLLEIKEQYTEYFTPKWKQVYISQATVNQAVEQAAKAILLSPEFKLRVPAAFGNKDMTLSGNDEKNNKRMTYLTSKITHLLEKCGSSKTVTIDESVEAGLLQLNGGIAGAIGNIFVLDDDTKLMKITNDARSLGPLATSFYEKLTGEIHNLHEYKFCFQVNDFPKLLLESTEYEMNVARDFIKKLIIYSNQMDEERVEKQLREEIEEYLDHCDFQAKTDAIFLRYHNIIQTWWKPKKERYLTKNSQIIEKATRYIITDPVMSSISLPYMRKIQQYNYSFTKDAVRSLKLDQHSTTSIIAMNSMLTVVKVMQHMKDKDHVVLDLEDIINLSTEQRNALRKELANTSREKVVTIVCNNIQSSQKERRTLENISEAVRNKKCIIITNHLSVQILERYFEIAESNTVHDKRNSLLDMNEESQINILNSARVKFQGIEVELEPLISGWPIVPMQS